MWVFLDGNKYTPSGTPNKMTHTAGEIYVTLSGRKVGVYHFFGQEDYNERTIDLSDYFTNDPYYICNGVNSVYVFEKGNEVTIEHDEQFIRSFVKISTITHEVEQHVVLPQEAHCYPTYARFKIWFTTPAAADITDTGRQSLFYYDTLTNTFSNNIEIPGNKQFRPHKIVWDKENFIFVDLFNENSVVKFNDTNGSVISQIIFNRKPKHMFVNGNKEVLVASYAGMVSKIDQTLDTYSNLYSTNGECEWFEDDGTYIWSVTPALSRTDKTKYTDNFISMDGDTKDFSIAAFSGTSFNQVIIVPQYDHQVWDDVNEVINDVTNEQFIVVLSNSNLWVATTMRDSWTLEEIRPYHLDVKVTAMVATGPEAYYGETL